ncbi:hypothetical protein MLD38_019319 [Melastoma candidum]|uniref:Uncharacterized protein n=1 Tax=Melastoma candidum TaxID=119954 RepID=A0ACB9R0N7_9MYRT|nr:hypothetical protein MLD38_019319 [Melastoma candidum]
MTSVLLVLCGLSSFVLSFTDSFRDRKGNLADQYRLQFVDFLHAFMSLLMFSVIALFDQNAVNCFYPTPSDGAKELLTGLPVAIGIVSSMLFVVFPTKRHGIGFPVRKD